MKISKKLFFLILFSLIFCLVSFWLACERDFSAINKIPLPVKPDTTSHNFTWTIDTIGTTSSYLLDVTIINENDIWAVGEIHTAETDTFDSLGNWVPPYNAAHWNGSNWELKRILYQGGFWTIRSIFAFSSYDVWFSAIVKWDGSNFIEMPIPGILIGQSMKKIWGISSNDLYIVGNNGLIAHYDGSSWQKLESGTTTNINDIWGVNYPGTGHSKILAVVSDRYHLGEYRLLSISPSGVTDTLNWNLDRRLHGVWFDSYSPVYICGSGVQVYQEGAWQEITLPNYFSTRIRGTAPNNVFVVGAFGFTAHFNGSSWRHYPQLFMNDGSLEGLDVKNKLIVAVGYVGNKAIIIKGIQM